MKSKAKGEKLRGFNKKKIEKRFPKMDATSAAMAEYDAHGIACFRTPLAMDAQGKKVVRPPTDWGNLDPKDATMREPGNAVCIRGGPPARADGKHVVVVDADGADAIDVVMRLLARTCETGFHARVPQVQTQRGPGGRHFYFFAEPGTRASTLGSPAGLVIDGAQVDIDLRAGFWNGTKTEGRGFVYAPPTVARGGGEYTLLPGPRIHEAPFMPDALARVLGAGSKSEARRTAGLGPRAQAPFRAEIDPSGANGANAHDAHAIAALTPAREAALKREALRAVKARAGTERVGYPTNVALLTGKDDQLPVWGSPVKRIEFTHSGARVCPVTRIEHDANHFFVALGVDKECTGLPAFFIYCHELSVCNPADQITKKGKRVMLTLVDLASYEELGIDPDSRPDIPTTLSIW